MTRYLLALAATLCLVGEARAQTAPEYVQLGKKIWSAFQCTVAAERTGNVKEQERLWQLGYDSGRAFIQAVEDKKVKKDIRLKIPLYITLNLNGP